MQIQQKLYNKSIQYKVFCKGFGENPFLKSFPRYLIEPAFLIKKKHPYRDYSTFLSRGKVVRRNFARQFNNLPLYFTKNSVYNISESDFRRRRGKGTAMRTRTALFFSTKYWTDPGERTAAAARIGEALDGEEVYTVVDGDLSALPPAGAGDLWQIVPCSGSVQPHILALCRECGAVLLFAAYVPGNFDAALSDAMLMRNAAPTVMDVYGVLRRDRARVVSLHTDLASLRRARRLWAARERVQSAKILLVRGPEPWVISVPASVEAYRQQLGVAFETVSQEELIALYGETPASDPDAETIRRYFAEDAERILAPTGEDLTRCARLGAAMLHLLRAHEADGMAVACFDLIGRLGVNPCLGVSYLNGETEYFAACEGDTDSAVTMLLARSLTDERPWMANPCLQADGTIHFAHCTAPLRVRGEKRKFWLCEHHETGVGTSPRVFYDEGMRLTMLRYGGVENVMTVQAGTSVPGRYEPNCRTQLRVRPDDMAHYLDTALGCHQVLLFDDITDDARRLAQLLGITVL